MINRQTDRQNPAAAAQEEVTERRDARKAGQWAERMLWVQVVGGEQGGGSGRQWLPRVGVGGGAWLLMDTSVSIRLHGSGNPQRIHAVRHWE